MINPLSSSVFFVKRFEKRVIEEPLSVLKVCLPPNIKCSESSADQVSSSPSEIGTISNPRGGANRKNPFYSAWNLFKLQCRENLGYFSGPSFTAFGRYHLWCD
ncbi:hypothetical protein AVEN_40982-1 [Araneus ventricosus]|uniref:Uncharacterized protein n=1 Tax=Araneus ventricosus TaxID=182803 RepID=A0A4Y2FA52_ARAVE|nr:hypothetical protein AVEN_40982-1 [Araneus ventricosus]